MPVFKRNLLALSLALNLNIQRACKESTPVAHNIIRGGMLGFVLLQRLNRQEQMDVCANVELQDL
jgi:hypothetical protein